MPKPLRKHIPSAPPGKAPARLRALPGGADGRQALRRQHRHERALLADVERIQGVEIRDVKRRIGV
jgi:hypothetical protein